jgi:cytochrome bd ubiquinol oxidase subunit II
MDYISLQHYWWFIVSLLGALLVFLMFVQGANSLVFSLGATPEERRVVINSTGRDGQEGNGKRIPAVCQSIQ